MKVTVYYSVRLPSSAPKLSAVRADSFSSTAFLVFLQSFPLVSLTFHRTCRYVNMSDAPISNAVLLQKLLDAERRVGELQTQLKQRDTLHTAGKIRYMMEVLEKKGRPQHITKTAWKFQKTREDKWYIIFAIPSHELHPWLRTFLDCLRGCCAGKTENQILNESQDIVKIIFDVTDKKIHTYFQDSPVDMSVFKSTKIKCAINCLNQLEPEIMAYHSGSTDTSSST